jgi:NADPH-dependent 2,4-dienoyl-CoA reductase/sulfur reductase-like enzyme
VEYFGFAEDPVPWSPPDVPRSPEFPRSFRSGPPHDALVHQAPRRHRKVIGGGPGGLKAAAVAAERGHRVTLYEPRRRVGGQVLLAGQLPGRAEFGGAITNLHGEARRAGVEIVTGVRVDAAMVQQKSPDAVIVATGSVSRQPHVEVNDAPVLLDARDVIGGAAVPSGRVVVADWRCDWVASE